MIANEWKRQDLNPCLSECRVWVLHYTQFDGELIYMTCRVLFSHRTLYMYGVSRHLQLSPLAHPLTKGAGGRLMEYMQGCEWGFLGDNVFISCKCPSCWPYLHNVWAEKRTVRIINSSIIPSLEMPAALVLSVEIWHPSRNECHP